jgi:cellulose synthase/poly-beta-1,6-N-acetylglucosamine synthase-like glycosyltransferase
MAPRYTVLLPTHNRADVVGLAIESVLSQTEPDFELFVVGDGCTDDTATVVRSFKDPRIKWFDLPKAPGFGYANRNIALREASGDLVAFMAHDDLVLPDHLSLMAQAFESPEIEWAYSRPLWVTDAGDVIPFAVDLRLRDQLDAFLTTANSIPASCVVYRRALHERVGMWPEGVAASSDWDLWKRMVGSRDGRNLGYVRSPTALHFRADWRTVDNWGPPPLAAWSNRVRSSWWPEKLRFSVAGPSPQRALATAIREERVVADLRAGVEQALDLLAWTQAEQIAQIEAEQLAAADAANVDLEQLRFAMRTIPFRRVIKLYRRLQVRLRRNIATMVGSVSPAEYLSANPDVRASSMDPLEHYYVHGMLEGRPTR